MTIELRYGEDVIAEVTDIIISPKFEDAIKQTSESIDALSKGLITLKCKINNTSVSFEELKNEMDRINKPINKRSKITERQIWKSLNRKG